MPYPMLASPLKLRGLTLKNRILSAPTSLAELAPGGRLSRENIEYYKLRAAGGCALVTVGESIVHTATGKSHPMQIALDDPDCVPSLKDCADAIHAHNAAASIELSHGGALCAPQFLGHNAKGPSGYVDLWGNTVEELTEGEILHLAECFGTAAARARHCGFDMVMIHGGHGWLLHQFLSPLTNHRRDRYGGSLANRMRFPLLAVECVRAAVGEGFPIEFRMSGDERAPGGYGIDIGIEIARMLDSKVDLLHVSAGTQGDEYSAILMHPGIFQAEGENAGYAAAIRPHVDTPVVTVGGFCNPQVMERTIKTGGADAIALGRALLADPLLPKKMFSEGGGEIVPCIRCGECQSGMMSTRSMRCTVNPLAGREGAFFHPLPVRNRKRVLVAGGGPGGMQAAITAQDLGHQVILCEELDRLGGMLHAACEEPFKNSLRYYRERQIARIKARPIELRLGVRVDRALVEELYPDTLIVAVGGTPRGLPIPGADSPHVLSCVGLPLNTSLGKRVVIIGGGLVGCEQAIALARRGHEVTLVEMREELAADCGYMHRTNLLHQIGAEKTITVVTRVRCTAIPPEGVRVAGPDGEMVTLPGDHVLLAVGMAAKTAAVEELRGTAPECYIIGDAARPSTVMQAVREGYDAAVDLGLY